MGLDLALPGMSTGLGRVGQGQELSLQPQPCIPLLLQAEQAEPCDKRMAGLEAGGGQSAPLNTWLQPWQYLHSPR